MLTVMYRFLSALHSLLFYVRTELPRLEDGLLHALLTATPLPSPVLHPGLPRGMLWVRALPPSLVHTAQGDLTWYFTVHPHPFPDQIRPLRQRRVARFTGLLDTAHRATGVAGVPVATGRLVRWVALGAEPQGLEGTAHADAAGVGVGGVPLLGEGGVVLHGAARAEGAALAEALGAAGVPIVSYEVLDHGLPLVQPAAAVLAARAAQPHLLVAAVCEVCGHLALVPVWVPQLLDPVVVPVRQGLPALLVERRSCGSEAQHGKLPTALCIWRCLFSDALAKR